MASVISRRLTADYRHLRPEEQLCVSTSDGGVFYVAPKKDPQTDEVQLWVTTLDRCTCTKLHQILVSCKATACGTPAIRLLSLPEVGAGLHFWVNHRVHGDPRSHAAKNVTIREIEVVQFDDNKTQ